MDNKRETLYLMYSTRDGYSPSYDGKIVYNNSTMLSIKGFYKWRNELYKPSYNPCILIGWF